MNKTIQAFLTGAFIIGGAKYISIHIGSMWAALLGGLPAGLIAAFFLKNNSFIRKFLNGYFIQTIVMTLIVYCLILPLVFLTKVDINVIAFCALLLWAFVSVLMIKYSSKKTKSKE
jgi:H+/Cl- antiporter ClcA